MKLTNKEKWAKKIRKEIFSTLNLHLQVKGNSVGVWTLNSDDLKKVEDAFNFLSTKKQT